ncbi:MAG: peptidoglycan-binding domain-containing protein [Saprospiraceae bacterium]
MKKLNLVLFFISMFAVAAFAQPTNAEAGKCYAKCLIPTKYETTSVPVTIKAATTKVNIKPATFVNASEQFMTKEAATSYSAVSAKFEKASKQVLAKDSYKVLKVVPAEFKTVTEKVLVKEAYKVAKIVPATYKTETVSLMVKPAFTTYQKKPANFRDEVETIDVSPKSTKWVHKKSDANCLSADPDDCMIWCLVETPAEYKTVTKKVLVGCDAGWTINGSDCVKSNKVDAVYKTYTKQVVDTPAKVEYTEYPAEFKTRTYQQLVSEAKVVEETVPAEYTTWKYEKLSSDASATESPVTAQYMNRTFENLGADASLSTESVPGETVNIQKTTISAAGGFSEEWREVVCEADVTPRLIAQVQRALIERGYSVGLAGVDNVFGVDTKAALKKFQQDKGLPVGNLDFETLKALGINQ